MYYYLLYNSSFSFIVENRLFSTILYGSILYILTHAILNYCDVSILTIINNYFWTTLTLDVISFTYAIYNTFMNDDFGNGNSSGNSSDNSNNSLNVSFNLLKNKINTMLDRKNDLTITHIPNTNQVQQKNHTNQINTNQSQKNNKVQIQENFNNVSTYNNTNNSNSSNNPLDDFDFTDLDDVIQPPSTQPLAQFSTPIKQLQAQKNNNNTNNNNSNNNNSNNTNNTNNNMLKASTPISLIRSNTKISEPIIQDDSGLGNESVAGSDVGSIMDLEDFENSF
jgi:hypothetical protein